MILNKDDFELTLKELKGQRVQLLLQLEVVEAGIVRMMQLIKNVSK